MITLSSRNLAPGLFLLGALLPACTKTPTEADAPIREEIVITEGLHHIGDNPGAEGDTYSASFQLATVVDSASLAITFLYPNPQGQSGPEIANPPQILINSIGVGILTSDFPVDACVTGTGDTREYSCDLTLTLPIADVLEAGTNQIEIISEAALGGDDDFVFTDLVLTVWR